MAKKKALRKKKPAKKQNKRKTKEGISDYCIRELIEELQKRLTEKKELLRIQVEEASDIIDNITDAEENLEDIIDADLG